MSHGATPYISDPLTPKCPDAGCRQTVYVQAESYEVEIQLPMGKTEKRVKYRVRNTLDETMPQVISACGCQWLREAVAKTKEVAAGN
jgi:hypothetical protein